MDMKFCKNRYINTVILGAGVAGLGAALKAREVNIEYEIFEAKASAGGLLDNLSLMDIVLIMQFILVLLQKRK